MQTSPSQPEIRHVDRDVRVHDTAWDRVREALARDWEQTRHDFGLASGNDLHQHVGDTVMQALGEESIPPPHVPCAGAVWSDEAALRYGYSAALGPNYHDHSDWTPQLELKLQHDWLGLPSGREWLEVRDAVRYGWIRAQQSRPRQ